MKVKLMLVAAIAWLPIRASAAIDTGALPLLTAIASAAPEVPEVQAVAAVGATDSAAFEIVHQPTPTLMSCDARVARMLFETHEAASAWKAKCLQCFKNTEQMRFEHEGQKGQYIDRCIAGRP
ncbi:MAG: hypothetical protein HY078_03285 [Elusimicrobia bacterium]|nr:hypothetical protein [Elusimicrobiota bacterium]